jgi:hypothetical protein
MANITQILSGEEFLQKLRDDQITAPILFTGMVKKTDDATDHILFTHAADCTNWIRIPVTSIENVEILDVVPSKEHTHPLVNLRIKKPQSTEGLLFLALAQQSRVPGMMPRHRIADPADAGACFDRYLRLCNKWFRKGAARDQCILRALDVCDPPF